MTEEEKARLAELKEKTELTTEETAELETLESKDVPSGKSFTQEQVNNLIKKESAKAVEKLLKDLGVDSFENAKDGIAKLKELEDSKKTDMEKLQEQITALTEAQNNDKTALINKDNQVALLKAGVPADKIDKYTKLLNTYDGDDLDVKMTTILEDFPINTTPVVDAPSLGGKIENTSSEKTAEQQSADLDEVFGIK